MAPRDSTLQDLDANSSLDTPMEILANPSNAAECAAAWLLGYAATSRRSYVTSLRKWGRWLDERGLDPFWVEADHVESFLADSATTPGVRDSARSALKGFYRYAHREGLVAEPPAMPPRLRAWSGLSEAKLRERRDELLAEVVDIEAELDERAAWPD